MPKQAIIKISVQDKVKKTGEAVAKTIRNVFANQPVTTPSAKSERKSISWTLSLQGKHKQIKDIVFQQLLNKLSGQRAVQFETAVRQAMTTVIMGIIGHRAQLITVFGRSLGIARATTNLENEAFVRFLRTPEGMGEIGLPDIDEALRSLKVALAASITVDRVSISDEGVQVTLRFNQRVLLKLTPHPNSLEGGAQGPFSSWLQLITGPQLITGGTPGFGLVRANDLVAQLRQSSSAGQLKRVEITHRLLSISRTRDSAGGMSAIMMSTQRGSGKRSPAETFGGITESYQPSRQFDGFWDDWWLRTKNDLSGWAKRIMFAALKAVIEQGG